MATPTSSQRVSLYPNIWVETHPRNFLDQVTSDLKQLESKEVGKRLITRIGEGKHAVFIVPSQESHCSAQDAKAAETRGKGCSSVIHYALRKCIYFTCRGERRERPNFVELGHELIHAYHFSYGKRRSVVRCDSYWSHEEEIHTIQGFPSKNPNRTRPKITENALLEEHGFPPRFSHYGCVEGESLNMPDQFRFLRSTQLVQNVFYSTLRNSFSPAPVVKTAVIKWVDLDKLKRQNSFEEKKSDS